MKRSIIIAVCAAMGLSGTAFSTPGDILKEFKTPGKCPTGLCFDGKNLWIADRLSDSLYSVDMNNGKIVKAMEAPGFHIVGLTWDGECLWTLDKEEMRLFRIDVLTGITVKSFECPAVNPSGMGFDGKDLWICDEAADKLIKISCDDGTMIMEFKAPAGASQGLCWDGKYLWCSDRVEDRIFMVDTANGEVLLSIDAPGKYARGLAWAEGKLWNVDYQSDKIFQLAADDGVNYKISNTKVEKMEFTHEFRNYGPGKAKTLDVYFAVPVERPNQKLKGEISYEPKPTDFITDKWGQKFAHFHNENIPLLKKERCSYKVKTELSEVRWFVFPDRVGGMAEIPADIKAKYLVDEDKYRINDPVIRNAVKEAVGGEQNPYWIMRKIYKYVRDKMYYELSGGWNVAPAVLTRGNGSCSEYSFVFISMCRAAGLPTKYVGSVVVRGDDASTDDVFHRWCECYLPNYGWVPIDPSGGDQDSPARAADYFGHVGNRYLITTDSGGNSEYMGWQYNCNEFWTTEGTVKVFNEAIGEWEPGE